jgi:hypothetical protein
MAIQVGAAPAAAAPAVSATQAPATSGQAQTVAPAPQLAQAAPAQDQFSAKTLSAPPLNLTGTMPTASPLLGNSLAVSREDLARLTSEQQGSLLSLLDSMKFLSEEDKGKLLDMMIEMIRFLGQDMLSLLTSILENVKSMGKAMSAAPAQGGEQMVAADSGGGEAPAQAVTSEAPAPQAPQMMMSAPQARMTAPAATPMVATSPTPTALPGQPGGAEPAAITNVEPGTGAAEGVLVDPRLKHVVDAIATDHEGGKMLKAAKKQGLESITVNPLLKNNAQAGGVQGVTWKMPNGKQRIEIADPLSWDVARTLTHELTHASTSHDGNSMKEELHADRLGTAVQKRVANKMPGYTLDQKAYAGLQKDNGVEQSLAKVGVSTSTQTA